MAFKKIMLAITYVLGLSFSSPSLWADAETDRQMYQEQLDKERDAKRLEDQRNYQLQLDKERDAKRLDDERRRRQQLDDERRRRQMDDERNRRR